MPAKSKLLALLVCILLSSQFTHAAKLPEDLYALGYFHHSADGMDRFGPFLQIRKQWLGKFALGASYQVETVEGSASDQPLLSNTASDQVETFALNGVLLREHGLLELSFQQNEALIYSSNDVTAELTQQFLAGLQSLHLGFGISKDEPNPSVYGLNDSIDHYSSHIGWQQIWSRDKKIYLDYQLITEKGPLGDPYAIAVINSTAVVAKYPERRTSHSMTIRYQQYLAKNSSASLQYQYYKDSWKLSSQLVSAHYQRSLGSHWQFQTHARFYIQDEASFYANNVITNNVITNSTTEDQQYLVRDKELSEFYNTELGFKLRRKLAFLQDFLVEEAFLNFGYQANFYEFDNYEINEKAYRYQSDLVQIYLTAKL
ncbi:MAG: hypothetical protein COB51_11975 [Moraxellaceae bacterium]|nr:MAG: hypothetical protein COB51_11975 [Moraxellaceae bacterium]